MIRPVALALVAFLGAQDPQSPPAGAPTRATTETKAPAAVDPRLDEWTASLVARLDDANPDIARSARQALRALGPAAESTLERLADAGTTDGNRAARRALESLRNGPPPMRRFGPGGDRFDDVDGPRAGSPFDRGLGGDDREGFAPPPRRGEFGGRGPRGPQGFGPNGPNGPNGPHGPNGMGGPNGPRPHDVDGPRGAGPDGPRGMRPEGGRPMGPRGPRGDAPAPNDTNHPPRDGRGPMRDGRN